MNVPYQNTKVHSEEACKQVARQSDSFIGVMVLVCFQFRLFFCNYKLFYQLTESYRFFQSVFFFLPYVWEQIRINPVFNTVKNFFFRALKGGFFSYVKHCVFRGTYVDKFVKIYNHGICFFSNVFCNFRFLNHSESFQQNNRGQIAES